MEVQGCINVIHFQFGWHFTKGEVYDTKDNCMKSKSDFESSLGEENKSRWFFLSISSFGAKYRK